jgi:molybdenum-dependent DNA-binding transcriptional regulator ModE
MLSRWVFGTQQGARVITPQFQTDAKLVSFLDFVQTLAIREIRLQKEVSLSKIRQAIELAKDIGMEYPFARKHCTYLLGGEVVIKSPEVIVEASGTHRGQRLFTFVETYLESLGFNERGLANLYTIYEWDAVPIKMRPGIRFGEPLLPSGYSAAEIWNAIQVEGGIAEAAKAYGIDEKEVLAAYRLFVVHLGKTAA